MFKLKKRLFLLLAMLFVAKFAFAAVVSIVDTEYSSSGSALKSSSGGTSSDSSHTSSYSGIKCGKYKADNAAGCNTLFGISDAESTPCDGGVTCSCPSSYDKECLEDNERGSGMPCLGKYKYCETTTVSTCSDIQAWYNNGGIVVESDAACQTAQGQSYTKSVLCDDGGTQKYFCVFEKCSVLANNPSHPLKTYGILGTSLPSINIIFGQGGIISGKCMDNNSAVNLTVYCNDDFTETTEPLCSDPLLRPETCSFEKEPLYAVRCDNPYCSNTDMTVKNLQTITSPSDQALCPTSGYQKGTADKLCQYFSSGDIYRVCKCPSEYAYTAADCDKEDGDIPDADTVPVVSVESQSLSGTTQKYLDYCAWDSQTEMNWSNFQFKTLDSNEFKYKKCLSICPQDSSITFTTSSTCYGNSELVHCAQNVAQSNGTNYTAQPLSSFINSKNNYPSNISYYIEKTYCQCPKDANGNDLWHATCQEGYVPGGRYCSIEGGIKKYEYCLPKCNDEEPRQSVAVPLSCGIWQDDVPMTSTNPGPGGLAWVCINKSGDGTTAVNCPTSPDSMSNYKCCYFEDKSKCSDTFLPVNGTSADSSSINTYCLPIQNNKVSPQLCFVQAGDFKVRWQCTCPNYVTSEECTSTNPDYQGVGTKCLFDSSDTQEIAKYQYCAMPCPADDEAHVQEADSCKMSDNTTAKSTECYSEPAQDTEEGKLLYVCSCPDSMKSLLQQCAEKTGTTISGSTKQEQIASCTGECAQCLTTETGFGTTCDFDAISGGQTLKPLMKYSGFGLSCEGAKEERGTNITIADTVAQCSTSGRVSADVCYKDASTMNYICKCPEDYKTLDDYCSSKVTSEYTLEQCKSEMVETGTVCMFDVDAATDTQLKKYNTFQKRCPDASKVPLYDLPSSCQLGDYQPISEVCYIEGNEAAKYTCSCPASFDSLCLNDDGSVDTSKIRGGIACSFEGLGDGKIKYEKCLPQCVNTATTPVVSNPDNCPLVNGVQANTEETCFNKVGDPTEYYACRCPKSQGYKTLEEYCGATGSGGGSGVTVDGKTYTYEECKSNFIGVGTPCTFDGVGTNKYLNFALICPSDRPLFYTADECSSNSLPGSVDYLCYERDNLLQQRVVCKCPESWVNIDGNDGSGTKICADDQEPSGQICGYEGSRKIKYEKCYIRCDKVENNGEGIKYLDELDATQYDCTNLLGEGATFGATGSGDQCSKSNTLAYPCFCGAAFTNQCLNNENEQPDDGALACTINGTTYYDGCKNNSCAEESPTTAVIHLAEGDDAVSACRAQYGNGASGKKCGNNQAECSCNAREYTELCEYPYSKPTDKASCKYGDGSTLMKNGQPHFILGECKVEPAMAKCGEHILINGTADSSYTIYVTDTESQCTSRYGNGAKTQLCEYADNNNKRAYNCYFNPSDFPVTEDSCPIRHVLSSEYIVYNGSKHYKSCDCHPAYKNHKYNCAGMLSGGACTQTLTASMINNDTSLRDAGLTAGNDIALYPYCQCTSDYNQVCDGERNVGVGEPCNGKYIACECKKDPLPENWVDNYYGCPGGKKPTGVIKPNGCGGKYYQCVVNECTWQHTEKCASPLVGVDGCQDNQGNIGGYKSCKCPDGYKLCTNGLVGKGEPCILNGSYYYTECENEGTCVRGETKTCQDEFLVGVNPCTRNDVTYFEYCKCASGFDKLCDNGEVGVGLSCKLDGKEYYNSCTKPATTCTEEHYSACDTNQEKYDPCVSEDNQLLYKCKCPSNWQTCASAGASSEAESCTNADGTVLYSKCAVENECTANQNKTYKECTSSQLGSGGSCIVTDGEKIITKYAECEETNACRLNGYQYTCLGFDQTALGTDSCIDENGNKLYKECKCPSNWITCPGKNNKKGKSCTALSEMGVSKEPVYESCSCDEFTYKYDCVASESGNVGVIPAKTKSCTPAVYDADSTGNRKELTTLYESCACGSTYKYTCTGNGQLSNDENFCQKVPNGEKLYTYCNCDSKYSLDCASSSDNPGLSTPRDENKICTPINPTDGRGNGPFYSSCECGQYYNLECTGNDQFTKDTEACVDPVSYEKYYKACHCDTSIYRFDCKPSGGNKGVRIPAVESKDTCVEINYVNNEKVYTNRYKTCICAAEYKYSCIDKSDNRNIDYTPEKYLLDSGDYCQNTSYSTTTDEEGNTSSTSTTQTRYKSCMCSSEYKTCGGDGSQDGIVDGASPCIEVAPNGSLTYKYLSSDCECKPKDLAPEGYTNLAVDNNINSDTFKNQVKSICKDYRNVLTKEDGCGKLYFKCIAEPSTYIWASDTCRAATPSGSVSWTTLGKSQNITGIYGAVTLYDSCGCATNYVNEYEACSEYMTRKSYEGMGYPYCYEMGHGHKDHTGYNYGKSCDEFHPQALIPKSAVCIESNGAKKYVKNSCKCNPSYFVNEGCYGSWSKHSQWCNVCKDGDGREHGYVTNWG